VNKILLILLLIFFSTSCSLDKKSGLWSKKKFIEEEKQKKVTTTELFKKDKTLKNEFNPNLKINLTSKLIKNSFINNFDNNNGRINYNGNLKNISKFKFSKIRDFNQFEPEISFHNNNLFFFDKKGSILKFDNSSNLIWKKNHYSKAEKKLKPILFFANNKNSLIVTDNIAKFYALDINTGNLLWSKNNTSAFNSQVKVYKDRFFAIDFDNVLRCYSIKDGSKIWSVKTERYFIKSQKKLSLIIIGKKVIFNNSIGDITAIDIETGNLLWQTPTQSSALGENAFFLKTSDLIGDMNSVLFSNNKNEFFSLDINTGTINWKQKINSNLRSTLIQDTIFSVSMEGFLFAIDHKSGNIMRTTDIFSQIKAKKRLKIKPTGFIVGSKNIYLTTNKGKLLVIDILRGKTFKTLKIDNNKISRPFVLNQNLFIIKEDSIIKLN
jgi:outer membrane protein assembly factor BamB